MKVGDKFYQNGIHGIHGGISKITYLGPNPVKPKECLFMMDSWDQIHSIDMSNEYIFIGDEIGARMHSIEIIQEQLDNMKQWLQQALYKQKNQVIVKTKEDIR